MLRSISENGDEHGSDDEDNNNNEEEELESWARIQQSTFLNWINDKLRDYDITCSNLKGDLKVCDNDVIATAFSDWLLRQIEP